MLIKPRLKTVYHKRLWKAFNLCTILTCIGLLGVSAISIYTNIYVHLVFAFALFICGLFVTLLSTVLDHTLKLPISPRVKMLRYFFTATGVLSGLLLGVFFVPYPFFGSLMEMASVASMTGYFCTFVHKLDKVESPVLNEWIQMERTADASSLHRRIVP
jgi:hypothetical protein